MKVGTFGGQIEALRREVRKIEEEERQRGNRRAFLGAVSGLAAGTIGALSVGALSGGQGREEKDAGSESAREVDRKVSDGGAHPLARSVTGPLPQLLAARWPLLSAIRAEPSNPTMRIGLSRFLHVAIDGTSPHSDALTRYLLALDHNQFPTEFGPMFETLRTVRAKRPPK